MQLDIQYPIFEIQNPDLLLEGKTMKITEHV